MVAILGFSQSSLFPIWGLTGRRLQTPWILVYDFLWSKKLVPHAEIEVNVAFSSSFNETSSTQKWHSKPVKFANSATQPFVFLDPNDVHGSLLAPRVGFWNPKSEGCSKHTGKTRWTKIDPVKTTKTHLSQVWGSVMRFVSLTIF